MKRLDDRFQRAHDDKIGIRQLGIGHSQAGILLQVDDKVFATKPFPARAIADLKNRRGYIRKVSNANADYIGESAQHRGSQNVTRRKARRVATPVCKCRNHALPMAKCLLGKPHCVP